MQPSLPFDADPVPPRQRAPQVVAAAPADTLDALAEAIRSAKGGDRLAPVTVIVASNAAGVMARRALGRSGGVLGVDVVTVGRVAELIAGPSLAAQRRRPVSDPVLEVTIAEVLAADAGMFAAVAHHPTTVTALREAHAELRLAGHRGAAAVAARSPRGGEVVRVSHAVADRLAERWYDDADILVRATRLVSDGPPAGLERLVLYLPQRFAPLEAAFVRALAALVPTTIVVAATGEERADAASRSTLEALGAAATAFDPAGHAPGDGASHGPLRRPPRVITTTDADDEVRIAVRTVVDAARGAITGSPVPFERIAVLWPAPVPYARLVEHHLDADGVPWNGRGGLAVTERLAPRLLLDLLDVDRRRFRRSDLFDLLADVPPRDAEGQLLPTAEWQRLTRALGISDDRDWERLRTVHETSRWARSARGLREFVDDLMERLGPPEHARPWREWAQWCDDQLVHWLGPRAEIHLSDSEYRAWEALMGCLDRLRSLDHVAPPASRRRFRAVLESELESVSVREGRIGTGVTVGSLASAPGLDLDVAIVLGGTDGVMPPTPRADPLLSDADRAVAGMATSDEVVQRLRSAFGFVTSSCHTVVTAPRGDLRATVQNHLTRWLDPDEVAGADHIASPSAGLTTLLRPPCERERRLRDRLRSGVPADPVAVAALGDPVLERAVAMRVGRASPTFTVYDGDLTGVDVPRLGDRPISPTQLQTWSQCPHAYFTRYLLGVRPIEEVDRDITIRALDSGTLLHEVLDRLHRDVLAARLPAPVAGWADEHRTALLAHFDQVCEETERRGRTGRPATWLGERARLQAELVEWLRRDAAIIAGRGAEIVSSEFEFGRIPVDDAGVELTDRWTPVTLSCADGRAIALFGSADRVDLWSDGTIVVTDHKTGKDQFAAIGPDDPTLAATSFQLPVYAAAATALGLGSGTVRAEYSLFTRGKWARRGLHFDEAVWARVGEALSHVVDGIEAGWFPLVPEPPGWRLYNACEHCDPDGLGTDAAWDRWRVKRGDPRSARWFAEPAAAPDRGDEA